MSHPGTPADQERWSREAAFFDEEYRADPISEVTIRRYLELRKPWLPAEYAFAVLGDLRGKSVLELGSGDGGNAILMALKGATVLGLDVSPRAVEIAQTRAALHGVEDRTRFVCCPLETFASQHTGTFDVICGWAVLHHVLPVLDSVLLHLKKLAHERTLFAFHEPVSYWKWLRRLRLMLPIAVHGTPDERPLEAADLALIRKHIPGLRTREYSFTARLARRITGNYESTGFGRRLLYDCSVRADQVLLSLPFLRGLAGGVTLTNARG